MISIIIPVFNSEKQIYMMLDCIKNQKEKDFEVLLIDDGSIDNSGKICDDFAKKDSRFRVIHKSNQGVSAARNQGMKEAKGEYIVFLDSDDQIPENYLYELLKTQKITKADIVLCDVAIISDSEEVNRFTYGNKVLNNKEALNLLLSRKNINSGPCAKLFCKHVLKEEEFPNLKVYEDILFVRNTFIKAKNLAFTNKTEYKYIQNDNGAMSKTDKIPSLDIIKATDDIAKFLCKHEELNASCFYVTLSHLMQYVQKIRITTNDNEKNEFNYEARKIFWKYKFRILFCEAFPWKEKLVFIASGLKILKKIY